MWGVFLTFFIKSYLKLYVTSALGVKDDTKTQTERLIPFIILLIMSAAPFFMLTGLINMKENFENADTKRKYGALTLYLRVDSATGYIFNFLYVFRRMLYGLSIAFLSSNPTS
jgi:hypothetical protein